MPDETCTESEFLCALAEAMHAEMTFELHISNIKRDHAIMAHAGAEARIEIRDADEHEDEDFGGRTAKALRRWHPKHATRLIAWHGL